MEFIAKKAILKAPAKKNWKSAILGAQFSEEGGSEGEKLSAILESSHVLSLWPAIEVIAEKAILKTPETENQLF